MSDRLHDTLSALRTDVDHTPLADSSAVRARGNQRTRRQAVGTSLAVVALVAGAVGIGGALIGGENNADRLPADDPTVSTSQTPAPDPTVETRPAIDTSVLLTADEMPPVPNQTFAVGETIEGASKADADERALTVCGVSPSTPFPDAGETAILRTFPSDLEAYAWQWVAQFDNEIAAKSTFNQLNFPCTGKPGYQNQIIDAEMPPTTFRSTIFSADPDSEYFGEFTGIALRGDTIVVFSLRGNLKEGDVDVDAFDDVLRMAADRVANR
jgi:hypothetical protein